MSKILCIIDGMTDETFVAGKYPNLVTMHLLRHLETTQTQEPESLGGLSQLLGLKKAPGHLQGYAEALAYGIPMHTNDLVIRGSWYALDEQGKCTVPTSAPECIPEVEGCRYYALDPHRCLLVLPGKAAFVSDIVTNPPYLCSGQAVENLCPKGCRYVSQLFFAFMKKDRCLLLWGQSVSSSVPPFPQTAAAVCAAPVVKGIAQLLGMTLIPVPGATGDVDTNLIAKAKAAVNAADTHSFVLLHLAGADEAAHRKNLNEKQAFLDKVDAVVLEKLLNSGHEINVAVNFGTDPVSGQHIIGTQPLFTSVNPKRIRTKADITEDVLRPVLLTEEQRKNRAIALLQVKAEELERLPTKADFDDVERIRIKAALGPWPRALEAAGLKERKPKSRR